MQLDSIPAVLAHELRNPLGGLVVHLDLLRQMIDPDDPRMASIDSMDGEVRRMERTIGAILDFARQGRIRRRRIKVEPLLGTLVERTRRRAEAEGVEFEGEWQGHLGEADLDPILVDRVLDNLLDNAFKAVTAGGRVTLGAAVRGDRVVLQVGDDGRGIAPENLERIFEPFYTGSTRGVGLGLALARRIVVDHGGELTVQSTPGRGSLFTLTLPRRGNAEEEVEEISHDAVAAR